MSAIIASLIAELSKVLIPLLIEWLKELFDKSAKKVSDTGDTGDDAEALVQAAIDMTPKARIFKRALLRKIKDHAADIATGSKLSKSDKAELSGLAAARAKSE